MSCRRTFRDYPQGVSQAQASVLAVICQAIGLSHRGIEKILSAFGISPGRMSSWRDVQAEAERLRERANTLRAEIAKSAPEELREGFLKTAGSR